jgi:hypothetical protein
MRIRILTIAALLPFCSAVLVVAQSGETLFQSGLAKERIGGDIPGAIGIYERIVRDFASNKALAAKTLIQPGGCYDKLGKATKAWPYYEQVINKYSDQKNRVVEARDRMAAASDARLLIKTPLGDLMSFAPSLPETESLERHIEALWQAIRPEVAYMKSLKQQFIVLSCSGNMMTLI